MNYTPGPWHLAGNQIHSKPTQRDSQGARIGETPDLIAIVGLFNTEADANLIAAAPNLLEALEGLLPWLTTQAELLDYASLNDGRASDYDMASVRARAAMLKAKGVQS